MAERPRTEPLALVLAENGNVAAEAEYKALLAVERAARRLAKGSAYGGVQYIENEAKWWLPLDRALAKVKEARRV